MVPIIERIERIRVMGKLTAQQQQQLADLEKLRDSDDGDDETVVWVRNSDGHETRLSGARAEQWLERNGYSVADADDSTKTEPLDAKTAAPAKATGKAAPKDPKTAPPADGEHLEQDAPATGRATNRKFF